MNRLAATIALIACSSFSGCATTDKADINPEDLPIEERVEHIRFLIESDPHNAELHYDLGNTLFDLRRYEEAVTAYEQTTEIDPEFADAYTNRGLAYRFLGDLQKAIELYQKAIALNPDDTVTLQNLILALRSAGATQQEIQHIERLIELRPSDMVLRVERGNAFVRLADYPKASASYQEVLALSPANVDALYGLGFCAFSNEEWDEAVSYWEKLTQIQADYPPAIRGLALAQWEREDYDKTWKAVVQCERFGVPLPPDFIPKLQTASGKLGPD